MVDLVVLQSLSYTAGAISVVLGVIYYAINLRESRRNGRIALANSLMQKVQSPEYHGIMLDLFKQEWKDYDDFEKKYGSDNNPGSYQKRFSIWRYYNSLGYMLIYNLIDADSLSNLGDGDGIIMMWAKFESIIRNMRKFYGMGDNWMWGFEYLAGKLLRVAKMRDPSYRVSVEFTRYAPDK